MFRIRRYEKRYGATVCCLATAVLAIAFLAAPAAAMVTGQTLIIDGGWSLASPMPR